MPRQYHRQYATNLVRHPKNCAHCGARFVSSRPDAVYHAPRCREAARRSRVAQLEADRRAEEAIIQARRDAEACAKLKAQQKPNNRKRKTKNRKR